MTIVIFLIILAALIFVHELGHFLVAKICGVRVDEFAIGFPPRIFGWKPKGSETQYVLNLIPFGGYVKIFGEQASGEKSDPAITGPQSKRSFIKKPKWVQVAVLSAGIIFNIIFAWLLFAFCFTSGISVSATDRTAHLIKESRVIVFDTEEHSPAQEAGFMAGDQILSLEAGTESLQGDWLIASDVQRFITNHGEKPLSVLVLRGKEHALLKVTPKIGFVESDPIRPAIGVRMDTTGTLQLPWYQAAWESIFFTADLVKSMAVEIVGFLGQVFTGNAHLSQVSGPVGIAGQVGMVRELGLVYVLSFAAFISVNLALLNIIPFPALDGGRILFVFIEWVKRSPISPKVANIVNGIGFLILIILMIVIAYHDIVVKLAMK